MVSCHEVLENLSSFIDNEVDNLLRAEIEAHLKMCRRCSVLHDTLRHVIVIAADGRIFELPTGCSERLHEFIDQHL